MKKLLSFFLLTLLPMLASANAIETTYLASNNWNKFSNNVKSTLQTNYDFGKVADVIDLGLSVKWASWNIGAEAPEADGYHFAWGELYPKTDYSSATYKFYNNGYTKYGSIDNKYSLDAEDDVAQQTWGKNWRIPTFEELKELKEKCTFTITTLNGVSVTKVEGTNGNYIYFPFPGNYTGQTVYFENIVGSYWSSNLETDSYAKDIDFENGTTSLNGDTRYHGQSIRPVYVDGNEPLYHDDSGKVPDVVDLGLSSGTLWAAWNIGASFPEEYGTYFAWGETTSKDNYDWSTYKFGDESNLTKYNSIDGLTELELEDDAAYVLLGKDWRMPTHEQELELARECSWEDVTINGVYGYQITGPNGNSIFMPRGGLYDGSETLSNINTCGWYWSSSLNSIGSSFAQGLCFFPSLLTNVGNHERCDGHNIRPVYVGEKHNENGDDNNNPNNDDEPGELIYYPRKVVMEEATGTWCGWCVRGIETIERMKKEYPDNFIAIALHSGDKMSNIYNYEAITEKFSAYPNCLFNRSVDGPTSVDLYGARNVVEQLKDNATAMITASAAYTHSDRSEVIISTETTFGFNRENAAYRIAYVVVEDNVGPYMQNNAYSNNEDFNNPSDYMYEWFLKSSPTEVVFNDVARGLYENEDVNSKDFPDQIQKRKPYENNYTFQLPSNIDNANNIRIVALLIDNGTGEIVNACQSIVITSENSDNNESDTSTIRTIHVATAGTLPNYISDSEKYTIEELTLTGELNGTDFRLLRDMAGNNYLGQNTEGKLRVLDFSGAKIVAGGEKYLDTNNIKGNRIEADGPFHYEISSDNAIPQYVFLGCYLENVSISKTATSIESSSFGYCSLTSITIPNSVMSIGNFAFEGCI